MLLKTKSPAFLRDFYYLDGLVSTGKRNSLHNIKNNFFYSKKFSNKFYTHFFSICGKQLQKLLQKVWWSGWFTNQHEYKLFHFLFFRIRCNADEHCISANLFFSNYNFNHL